MGKTRGGFSHTFSVSVVFLVCFLRDEREESNCVFMVVICWVNVLSGRECLDCKCEVMV